MKRNSTPLPAKGSKPVPAPRRGDVWWVRLDPTLGAEIKKTRPCLVLSTNVVNMHRRTVVVIPLSTTPGSRPPLLVRVHCAGRPAIAVTDQVRAVTKERLLSRIGNVSDDDLAAVENGLREILEL